MKEFTVLTINPGSTSTKVGIVKGDKVVFDGSVDHDRSEFAECKTFADQYPIRLAKIYEALDNAGIDKNEIDGICGRGVGLYACEGGTYKIDDLVCEHATNDVGEIHHPATLGIVLAYNMGKELGVPAFYVNPMPTDELKDVANILILPRFKEQAEIFEGIENVSILKPPVDTSSIIKKADLVIGAGGTMNREAAILQTPVISCYPGETLSVDQYYINKGLMYRSNDSEKVIHKALEYIVEPRQKIDVKTDDLFNVIIDNLYDLAYNGK